MSTPVEDHLPEPSRPPPEALLDALRAHPEWTDAERQEVFGKLVAHYEPHQLLAAVTPRLGALGQSDGEAVLRLLEAFAGPELLERLAQELELQPDLPPERLWEALAVLEDAGLLDDHPALCERWDELAEAEAEDEEATFAELAEQIEEDPDSIWVPLQGLEPVEPEVRAEIVSGLGQLQVGPGVIEFLRLLGFAHDPRARSAALDVLAAQPADDPAVVAAWTSLAADHPDAEVAARARGWLGARAGSNLADWNEVGRPVPLLLQSSVSACDGQGRGWVVLVAQCRGRWAGASFGCNLLRGVVEVAGQIGPDRIKAADFNAGCSLDTESGQVTDAHGLALSLLAGSLLLCDARTTPVLRFWLERTAGPALRPRPFRGLLEQWDPAGFDRSHLPAYARSVLDACPAWLDRSPRVIELAEEIVLRQGRGGPDPLRDAAIYRYLFEHRLEGRLELYRRMLLWMASFWHAAGAFDRARSALALAIDLADHGVPAHPFIVELATRSLQGAMAP